jgi:hypothetical protein
VWTALPSLARLVFGDGTQQIAQSLQSLRRKVFAPGLFDQLALAILSRGMVT